MDNTLESIKLSGNHGESLDLSFIRGRDPSILAYGQRPFIHENTKKHLDYLYEDEVGASTFSSSIPSASTLRDTIKVYLRLRPFPENMRVGQREHNAFQIINSNTLLTKLPSQDNNTSSLKRHGVSDTVSRKFTFTDTFGPQTTQLQIFEQIVKQPLDDFLNGHSATVMSYGTTNSGKSYTLQGTTASPGIIPRSLEYVFGHINPRLTPCYKPLYNTTVVSLDASAIAYELESKTKLLAFGSIDKSQYIQAYESMQKLLREESPLNPSKPSDTQYAVWVSFAEIYNETVFDLLSNGCQKKRPPLKLATDKNGKAFIKDLKMVCVNSGSEAYELLMAGQDNLKIAATALNTRSSRSHAIFTIKLLKYSKENSPNDVEVSTFSFCDLAGSERLKKTLNAGDRLKEAQNINRSLLVLGRCLKSVFDVQSAKSKTEVIGPYRESKLTRLFQLALSGKEHIALIVNVNPVPNLYNETLNVLTFSAIAKQIVIEPVTHKQKASNSRFSLMVSQSLTTVTDWDVTELKSIEEELSCRTIEREEYVHIEDYNEVLQQNEKLKKEVAQLKCAALNNDFEIRQEMSNIYTAMIDNLEANFKNRLKDAEEQQADMLAWSVKHVEDYYKEKLSTLCARKRSRIDTPDDSDNEFDIEELEAENVELTAKVESLKKSIKELRESKEELLIKNNQNAFELSLAKKDLANCRNLLHAAQNDIGCGDQAKEVIEELKTQLTAREEQIKSLKDYLNDAKKEFLRINESEKELRECFKEKDQELVELSEKIAELTEQLESTDLCLAQSTETIENLEEKLDIYTKNLATAEENLQNAEDQCSKATTKYLVLLKENEELKRVIDEEMSCSKIDVLCQTSFVNEEATVNSDENLVLVKQENINNQDESAVTSNNKKNYTDSETVPGEPIQSAVSNGSRNDQESREKVEQLKLKNNDLKTQLLYSELRVEELSKELNDVKEELKSAKTSVDASEQELVEKKDLVTSITNALHVTEMELAKTTEEFDAAKSEKTVLENRISESEKMVERLQGELEESQKWKRENSEASEENLKKIASLEVQLSEMVEKVKEISTKRSAEHEDQIAKLEKDIYAAKERDLIKEQLLDAHIQRISKLEKDIAEAADLRERLTAFENELKICEEKKRKLEKQLDENCNKIKSLESELQASIVREQDKENETVSLQKEIKRMIQTSDSRRDMEMEKEVKKTLRELAAAQQALADSEAKFKVREQASEKKILLLEMKVKTFEENASYLAMLKEGAEKRQAESEQLRILNKELKKEIEQKNHELVAFNKNRDDTIQRYETLVKQLQEEVDRSRREVSRYQELFLRQSTPTPRKEEIRKLKDELESKTRLLEQAQTKLKKSESMREEKEIINTSEDEHLPTEARRTRRRGKNVISVTAPADISVIELSGSESKRVTRRTALAPPATVPSVEKRKTRKKKLFASVDEACVDVEPTESTPRSVARSPLSATRNLRNRRK